MRTLNELRDRVDGFGFDAEKAVLRFGFARLGLGRIAAVENDHIDFLRFGQPRGQFRRIGGGR